MEMIASLLTTPITPLIISYLPKDINQQETLMVNTDSIMSYPNWEKSGGKVFSLGSLAAVQVWFTPMGQEAIKFDPLVHDAYTIISPMSEAMLKNLSESNSADIRNTLTRQIISIFSGGLIQLHEELQIYERLVNESWSFRVVPVTIYPYISNGKLLFGWI